MNKTLVVGNNGGIGNMPISWIEELEELTRKTIGKRMLISREPPCKICQFHDRLRLHSSLLIRIIRQPASAYYRPGLLKK
jgi:hypothetical protein